MFVFFFFQIGEILDREIYNDTYMHMVINRSNFS